MIVKKRNKRSRKQNLKKHLTKEFERKQLFDAFYKFIGKWTCDEEAPSKKPRVEISNILQSVSNTGQFEENADRIIVTIFWPSNVQNCNVYLTSGAFE